MSNYNQLKQAVISGNIPEITTLFNSIKNEDIQYINVDILHHAIFVKETPNQNIFNIFLKKKFNLDICNEKNKTVLQLCIKHNKYEYALLILNKQDMPKNYEDLSKIFQNNMDICCYIIQLGFLKMLQWIFKQYNYIFTEYGTQIADYAAMYGDLAILEWLYSIHIKCSDNGLIYAAINNHLHIIEYLACKSKHTQSIILAMDYAAIHGNIDTLIWLYKRYGKECSCYAMDNAARNGHYNVVKWLYENDMQGTTDAIDHAAGNGHKHIVKFLCEKYGNRFTINAIRNAKLNGFTKIANYLINISKLKF